MLDALPDFIKEEGYPDAQEFIAIYRKEEAIVEQYNCDIAECEHTDKRKRK